MELQPSSQSSSQKVNYVNTSKRLVENRNWTFPVVHDFTWKLEFFSNILSVFVVENSVIKIGLVRLSLENGPKLAVGQVNSS